LKIADADTAENDSGSLHYVVTPLSCALPNRRDGGPNGSGDERLKIGRRSAGQRTRTTGGNAGRGIARSPLIATLFQPQLSSRPMMPHRFLLAFLRAAMRFRRARAKTRASRAATAAKRS
jgi:hypothetical protein